MNKVITQNELVALIAERSGCDAARAEAFLKWYFKSATDLMTGGHTSVLLPGIGNLTVADGDITFKADPTLADEVNAPFSIFEPTEVAPGVTERDLEETELHDDDVVAQPGPEPEVESEPEPDPEPEYEEEEVEQEAEEEENKYNEAEEDAHDSKDIYYNNESAVEEPAADDSYSEDSYADEYDYPAAPIPHRRALFFFLGLVVGMAIGGTAAYILLGGKKNEPAATTLVIDTRPQAEETVLTDLTTIIADDNEPADDEMSEQEYNIAVTPAPAATTTEEVKAPAAIAAEEVKASAGDATQADATVYDTVRPGYFLTKMAKKHYGVEEFWVYIYEENKSKIKDPNKLPAGFKVVIPPAGKYGIDASDAASVEKAKNKAHELNKQFK